MAGLREAQKQATRAALRAHALRLFAQRGFRGTTIGEIAAAAKVSPRTFFLHFTSKEDVLLGQVDEHLAQLRTALATSPAGLDPLGRIEYAFTGMAADLETRDDLPLQLELLETVPAMLGAHFERFMAFEDAVADAVGTWTGPKVGASPGAPGDAQGGAPGDAYPALVAAVCVAAVRAAVFAWYDERARDEGLGGAAVPGAGGNPAEMGAGMRCAAYEQGALPRMVAANFAILRTGLAARRVAGRPGGAWALRGRGHPGEEEVASSVTSAHETT